jgi:toxin ParE1/3/4
MPIVWSPQSILDLRAIRDYIAKDSEQYADLTIARIFFAVERLLRFPQSGRIVPERDDPEIREIIVGRFRVVYRFRGAAIEVATVFRSSKTSQINSDARSWLVCDAPRRSSNLRHGSARKLVSRERTKILVGTGRFELPTPRTPSECSTRLSHVPTERIRGIDRPRWG